MAYATQNQVQAYIATTPISGSTQPNSTQIAQIIADRAALIDSALGSRGYVVPVIAPAWFVAELGVLNARGAAGDVLAQSIPAYPESEAREFPYVTSLLDEFTARIAELQEGIGIPVGLARQELQQSAMGYLDVTGAWGNNLEVEDDFGILIRSKPAFTRNRDI